MLENYFYEQQKYAYNYNIDECNQLFKRDVFPIGRGRHDKTVNTFIIFMLTKQYRQLEKKYKQNNKLLILSR